MKTRVLGGMLVAIFVLYCLALGRGNSTLQRQPVAGTNTEKATTEGTTAVPLPEEWDSYLECLDRMMGGEAIEAVDCALDAKAMGDDRLIVLIGDSTARKHAGVIDSKFPSVAFTEKEEMFVESNTTKDKVTYSLVFLGVTRFFQLGEVAKNLRKVKERYGRDPDLVLISGFALHECKNTFRNDDPFFEAVLKKRIEGIDVGQAKSSKANGLAVAAPQYLDMQRPCTLEMLKKMRKSHPRSTMIWRTPTRPVDLFEGTKAQEYNKKSCKKIARAWRPHHLRSCSWVYEWHQTLAEAIRKIGYGILRNEPFFPTQCHGLDGLHLARSCHEIFKNVMNRAARVEVPDVKLLGFKTEKDPSECKGDFKKNIIGAMKPLNETELRHYAEANAKQQKDQYSSYCREVMGESKEDAGSAASEEQQEEEEENLN